MATDMNKDSVSCGKCKHCSVVVVPDGATMVCPYHGRVGYFVKECKDYDPEEKDVLYNAKKML